MNNENCNTKWINETPFPMMATDESGIVSWVNPAFEELCAADSESLIGLSSDNPPAPNLTELLGTKNPVQILHPERGEIWLERTIKKVNQEDEPPVNMHYFHEVTTENQLVQENLQLKQQIENLTLTDELTGLANERALSQHLATQVTRSRRYNNPLTLVVADLKINDESSHILDQHYDDAILAFSHFLRERLRWADFIARCNPGRFVIILPETSEQEANSLFNDILKEIDKIDLPEEQKSALNFQFGLAAWEKGNDPKMLVERASRALG